jgi:dihydrofolate reductase
MRKVIVQEFTTIDGFAAGPNGEIDFIADFAAADPTAGEHVEDQLRFLETIDTILLGAVTYRMFAEYWPSQTTETELIADALNATPKVVFSRRIDDAPWGSWEPARVVNGSATEEVRRLKQVGGKDMVLWGSLSLAGSLMDEGLVDEYRLWVCAVLLGQGRRLFTNSDTQGMRWLETKPYGDRIVSQRFEPSGS